MACHLLVGPDQSQLIQYWFAEIRHQLLFGLMKRMSQ